MALPPASMGREEEGAPFFTLTFFLLFPFPSPFGPLNYLSFLLILTCK